MNVRLRNDEKIRVLNGIDLYDVMVKILKRSSKIDRKKAHFWVVGLDVTQEILFIELLQYGGRIDTITPMQVFSLALKKEAFQVVLVHNEPSGDTKPSDAIKEFTGKVFNVGGYLDVPLWDHMIITEKTYFSFLDSDLLEVVGAAVKLPASMKEQILQNEKAEMDLVNSLSKSAVKLHRIGMPPEQIAKIIDLPESEIRLVIDEFEQGTTSWDDLDDEE